jgi:hypothetical protein
MQRNPNGDAGESIYSNAEQVIEPTCSSTGFAWLADVFMVDEGVGVPKVEIKAVWVQSEKRVVYV